MAVKASEKCWSNARNHIDPRFHRSTGESRGRVFEHDFPAITSHSPIRRIIRETALESNEMP